MNPRVDLAANAGFVPTGIRVPLAHAEGVCRNRRRLVGAAIARRSMAAPICASWNHLYLWIRAVDGLRKAA